MIEIPGYKIHREIDSSDYCHSYSAIQLSSGKTMVVSVFSHSATQYSSFQSFFNNIEKKIAHQVFGVIAPIKEFIKTPKHTYIISDLLSNSCQHVYKDKAVDINTLFNEFYKIVLSLNLYHQVGFYHGGVSLDNLFHDADDSLTLGLPAFNQNFSTEDKALNLNQESYKAPEKEVSLSKTRDFYALGVVLYELIFKQKPFVAVSIEQLTKLKNAAVIHIPNSKLDHLKPLFTALLNPNPKRRIATANDFKNVAKHLGFQLENITYTIKPIANSHNQPLETPTKENKQSIPLYFYYSAAVLFLVIGVSVFISSSNHDTLIDEDINISENMTEEPPNIDIIKPISNKPSTIVYDEKDFIELVADAKEKSNNKQFAASLMAINQALKIHPNNKNAVTIQLHAKNELKINAIIKQAEQHIKKGYLTSPIPDNAYAMYQKLQKILPKGDNRAANGYDKISQQYYFFALKQFNTNENKTALININRGLSVLPNHIKLNELKNTIFQKQIAVEQARQAKIVEEDNKRIALIELKKQQELDLQRQKQLAQQREAERRLLISKQQKLNRLYTDAETYLNDTQLSADSINKAIINLNSLDSINPNSARNRQLRLKIDNAYVSLTEYQISINDYQLAQNTINIGLIKNKSNIRLESLRNQINTLIAQQNTKAKPQKAVTKEKTLPIFGTF